MTTSLDGHKSWYRSVLLRSVLVGVGSGGAAPVGPAEWNEAGPTAATTAGAGAGAGGVEPRRLEEAQLLQASRQQYGDALSAEQTRVVLAQLVEYRHQALAANGGGGQVQGTPVDTYFSRTGTLGIWPLIALARTSSAS